jgi:predicted short-subunit dehydrogenase-like oxidoreductase (DUF2520 family)
LDIAIIGPGKVGTAIGIRAARAGWRVVAVGGRDQTKAQATARAIGPAVASGPMIDAAKRGQLVLLTVTDDAIVSVCRALAGAGAFSTGGIVAHCSGTLGSDVLATARARGCAVGSMHPLQTFPSVQAAVDRLSGTYCFIEGDDTAASVLEALARDIGGLPLRIAPADKPIYHAAGVMACNYLTALIDAAMALCARAGIDRATAMKALSPLVRATVDNVFSASPESALTGPIARGDAITVEGHLRALASGDEDLDEFYRAAGKWTVAVALRKGTISPAVAEKLRKLLAKDTNRNSAKG